MDTRIYEPVGGGKVTMYYTGDFYRTIAPFDIFVDEEMTTAPTNEEFMDAFNSGMVLITVKNDSDDIPAGTIFTIECVYFPDGGGLIIKLNTDNSGATYTVYYVAEASMVPGAELELTEIFVNRNLTTAVTMSEFLSAVNSGTVMLFHTSGAYEYHTTIRQVKRVGNTVTVIPDIEEQVSPDVPTVVTAYVSALAITVNDEDYNPFIKLDSSSELGYTYLSSSEVEEILKKDIVKIFMITDAEDSDSYRRVFVSSIFVNAGDRLYPHAIGDPFGTLTMTTFCAYEDIPAESEGGT